MALAAQRALGAGPLLQQALRAAPALAQLCAGALAASHASSSSAAGLAHLWDPRRPLPPPLPPASARGFASASTWRQQREAPPSAAAAAAEQQAASSSSSSRGQTLGLGTALMPEMPAEAAAAAAASEAAAAAAPDGSTGWQNDPADCEVCETVPKMLDAEATAAMKELQLGRYRGGSTRPLPTADSPHEQVGGGLLGSRGKLVMCGGVAGWLVACCCCCAGAVSLEARVPWPPNLPAHPCAHACAQPLPPWARGPTPMQVFKADAHYVGSKIDIYALKERPEFKVGSAELVACA